MNLFKTGGLHRKKQLICVEKSRKYFSTENTENPKNSSFMTEVLN